MQTTFRPRHHVAEQSHKIADYKTRHLVYKCLNTVVCQPFGAVHHRSMCERFYRSHTNKCRKIQIDGAQLSPSPFEIGSDECVRFSIEALYSPKSSCTRDFFDKHAMKLRINAMSLDHHLF